MSQSLLLRLRRAPPAFAVLALLSVALFAAPQPAAKEGAANPRVDGAEEIPIGAEGSLQNAAFSPDGSAIVLTRFRNGYNKGPADVLIFNFATRAVRTLIGGDGDDVSQPGSTWNARTGRIVFSSDRDGVDQVFTIGSHGATDTLRQLTSDAKRTAFEPSLSPDGRSVVFESHPIDKDTNGVIMRLSLDSGQIEALTSPDDDCRQPNWSPAGNEIVYQRYADDQWDLWIYDLRTKSNRRLTEGPGSKTDATFSPDGRWVLYSGDHPDMKEASLFVINLASRRTIQITHAGFYDGAPSWSPDGKIIVFESMTERPTGPGLVGQLQRLWRDFHKLVIPESPTRLWKIDVPADLQRQLCLAGASCR
jgi:TolB protein